MLSRLKAMMETRMWISIGIERFRCKCTSDGNDSLSHKVVAARGNTAMPSLSTGLPRVASRNSTPMVRLTRAAVLRKLRSMPWGVNMKPASPVACPNIPSQAIARMRGLRRET